MLLIVLLTWNFLRIIIITKKIYNFFIIFGDRFFGTIKITKILIWGLQKLYYIIKSSSLFWTYVFMIYIKTFGLIIFKLCFLIIQEKWICRVATRHYVFCGLVLHFIAIIHGFLSHIICTQLWKALENVNLLLLLSIASFQVSLTFGPMTSPFAYKY